MKHALLVFFPLFLAASENHTAAPITSLQLKARKILKEIPRESHSPFATFLRQRIHAGSFALHALNINMFDNGEGGHYDPLFVHINRGCLDARWNFDARQEYRLHFAQACKDFFEQTNNPAEIKSSHIREHLIYPYTARISIGVSLAHELLKQMKIKPDQDPEIILS